MSHRTLWCLVKGDPVPYDVFDLPIGTNVFRLKARIKDRIQRLHDTNPDDLKLFKLKMMVPISPDDTLVQRLGNIDAYSTKLNSTEKVGELFPEPHSEDHLHIVVQRPEIVPSSSFRKRPLSATEDDGQAAKRMEIGGNVGDIQTRRITIHKAIPAMPDNPDLSKPSTFLWNLTDTRPLELEDTLAQHINVLGDLEDFAQKLILTLKMLSQQNPLENHVHIHVQLPPPSKTIAWLMELHSKIWGRKDLESQLYRNIKVTVADFHALQDALRRVQPDRDSPDYISKNVLLTKLEFLRSMSASATSPAHSINKQSLMKDDEDVEESDDDDEKLSNSLEDDEDRELNSFLPATLEFLDLSSLELQNVSARFPLPLFIREEYGLIEGLLEEAEASVVVSGQPGTGKTAFLHHKVIKNMLHGCPFLYQAIDGNVYHVTEKVEKIDSWAYNEAVVAFVDSDSGEGVPKSFLYCNSVQIIAASSPGGARHSWLKQKGRVDVLAANLWSRSELFLTGIFLHHNDLTLMRLIESIPYFNCNPRNCFDASASPKSLARIQKQIAFDIRSSEKSVETLLHDTFTSKGVSHSIFEISPSNDQRSLYDTRIEVVSGWALGLLLKKCEDRQANAAAELYRSLAGTPDAGTLRGRMLEKKVLDYFSSVTRTPKY